MYSFFCKIIINNSTWYCDYTCIGHIMNVFLFYKLLKPIMSLLSINTVFCIKFCFLWFFFTVIRSKAIMAPMIALRNKGYYQMRSSLFPSKSWGCWWLIRDAIPVTRRWLSLTSFMFLLDSYIYIYARWVFIKKTAAKGFNF